MVLKGDLLFNSEISRKQKIIITASVVFSHRCIILIFKNYNKISFSEGSVH